MPTTEEDEGGDEGHGEGADILGKVKHGKLHARVFDVVACDELGLGLHDVKWCALHFG